MGEGALLWLRNDLRLDDNPALEFFLTNTSIKSRTAIFFVSEAQWKQHHFSDIKIDFIKRHLALIKKQLSNLEVNLEIIYTPTFAQQADFIVDYCKKHKVQTVFANSEPELNEQRRDKSIIAQGVNLRLFEADVIVPKGALLNQNGEMYKVFSAFKRAWVKWLLANGDGYHGSNNIFLYLDAKLDEPISDDALSSKWPLVTEVYKKIIPSFLTSKVNGYKTKRDIPGIKGTSGLSPYLAAGLISPRYLYNQLLNYFPDLLLEQESSPFSWLNELIWRDFYRHLIFAKPALCKGDNFNTKYQSTKWINNLELFNKWCLGQTGYPIVDAAMRQLNQTGWMHNRLRMITASFLSKHLLVDWRLGEQYFMQHLIDGDFASNNGGWQWAAGTGCDAQPYFRVFNPIRQSERFDPSGAFIRKYIPELAVIPDKHIHFPEQYIKSNNLDVYWPAIVDHKQARLAAIDFYK